MQRITPLLGGALLVALASTPATAQNAALTPAEFDALLANAEVHGPVGQPELIIPADVPGWAQAIGVTGAHRHYKGLCGPDGAAATIEQLVAHAERDLGGFANRGGLQTMSVGTSPRFDITYDPLNALLVAFYLNDFIEAAEFVDRQFNNRVTNRVSLDVESIPGSTIGSAGSTRYTIPWSTYVEGLRESSDREDDDFADNLPLASLPVRYGFPGTAITNETQIRVTDAQLRAVFGETAVPPTNSVSITLDSDNAWSFFGCAISPTGSQLSLVDVAVHEITHSLGFTSDIPEGGDNSNLQIQGLDVARFFLDPFLGTVPGVQGGPPITNQQFTAFERHGRFTILSGFSSHVYSSTPNGFTTILEEGVDNQPSHLARRDTFADKLGIMDPVLISGTTFCDSFYSPADTQPLDDMGWTYITLNAVEDCNNNGLPDIIDIVNGSPDTNTNLIPDVCENFAADVSTGPGFTGLTLSEWSAPGLSTLSGFNPANFDLIFRGATDDSTINHNSSADIVARVSGFFNAPTTGEYAFRVGHDEPATLRVAGQTLMAINDNRSLQRGSSSTKIAPQNFINLDAGTHAFELTVILNSSSDDVSVIADSPSLGGWRALNQGDFVGRLSDFPDCNSNGIDDQFDADSDGDGIPDDCERDCDNDGIADETQVAGDLAAAIDLGTVSAPGEALVIETVGSDFDTEIGLYDAAGNLIDANDDIQPGVLQSRITETLAEGDYVLGVGGFNVAFSNGPAVAFLGSNCNASGNLEISFGSATGNAGDSTTLASGRTQWYTFSVVADCDGDGTPDAQELDCDNNGVPDDCEIPDTPIPFGTIGASDEEILIATFGSTFDTEIAVWNDQGVLLETDDDSMNTPQSQIRRTFEPGTYTLAVCGFNTVFSDFDPPSLADGIAPNAFGACSEGGFVTLAAGAVVIPNFGFLAPGRVIVAEFSIEQGETPCNAADLAEPFGILDLSDINAFVSAFTGQDLLADLNGDGLLDLSDINLFVTEFTAGCP